LKSGNLKWGGVEIEEVMESLLNGAADEEEAEDLREIISHMNERESSKLIEFVVKQSGNGETEKVERILSNPAFNPFLSQFRSRLSQSNK
jgi:hypothetical protein